MVVAEQPPPPPLAHRRGREGRNCASDAAKHDRANAPATDDSEDGSESCSVRLAIPAPRPT
eukprot:8864215-Alexandrium_andersonii.AAC.1